MIKTITELFAKQAAKTPNAIAIRINSKNITYSELRLCVGKISQQITSLDATAGEPIGLFIDISVEMVASYIAILNNGFIAVPIDPESPQKRRQTIFQDAKLRYCLTQDKHSDAIAAQNVTPISIDINTAIEVDNNRQLATYRPIAEQSASDPAVIIYTSGSTGQPKGVVITHGNLVHYVTALERSLKITKQDTYLLRGSISLIVSARQLLVPLSLGASVVIATKEQRKDPLTLLTLAKNTGVTIFDHVPSFWKGLESALSRLEEKQKQELFNLDIRLIATGGEPIPKEVIRFWFHFFPKDIEFLNLYGQTEGTGVVSTYKITESDLNNSPIPIGNPVQGMKIRILDSNLEPVAAGEKGEICIYGKGVAKAYWNKQEQTNERFITKEYAYKDQKKPARERLYKTGDYGFYRQEKKTGKNSKNRENLIELVGRFDNQVNIRGYRVELGEVEKALSSHPFIDQAIVIDRLDKNGEAEILGYFTTKSGNKGNKPLGAISIEPKELTEFLSTLIPQYMIPSVYSELEEIPLTISGKIDYNLLKSSEYQILASTNNAANSLQKAPGNETQARIAKVWSTVLNLESIGINQQFFDLGGNSLKSIQLIAEVEKEFEHSIAVSELHQLSTIENMAKEIQDAKHTESNKTINTSSSLSPNSVLSSEEYKKLLSIILGSRINQLKPGSLILKLNETGKRVPLFWCFNSPQEEMTALVKHLPADQPLYGLISSVPLENNQETLEKVAAHYLDELLEFFPNGPFRLGGNCRGAKVMCEIVRMLGERGIKTEKLCLLEFFHPNLYQFEGDLCLLFGKYSHLKRFELLDTRKENRGKFFIKRPMVEWIYCGHGLFFNDKNIASLSEKVKRWLYDDKINTQQSIELDPHNMWDRLKILKSSLNHKLSRLYSFLS